jgi:hypothetical protein
LRGSLQFVLKSMHFGGRSMSGRSVAQRYQAIIADLSATDIAAIWRAYLFGRAPLEDRLLGPVAALQALRNDRVALAAERSTLLAQKAQAAA